jgi:cytosine/adenosine deaminase-related metal-dependent hydrolase
LIAPRATLFRGARALLPGADPHAPPRADVLVAEGRIAALAAPGDPPIPLPPGARIIDCTDRLLIPGLVSAHYHSYDTLLKGAFEDLPFDVWALLSQPAPWGPRRAEELRLRTLLGAMEALRAGITTIQDMNSLVPQDEPTLDAILGAYRELGIRTVFSVALRDLPDLDIAPFLGELPPEVAALVGGTPRDAAADLGFVAAQLRRLAPLPPTLHWALSASGPQRSSPFLLEGLAALSADHGLPVFTHVYETRAQLAKARRAYADLGGSMIAHLRQVGLLTPRTTLAHAVWITPAEMAQVAAAGAGVVLNPLANLKLKNGVAPIARLRAEGVRLALGCDNNSCSDCQNLFQAMKLMCLLAQGLDAEPCGITAETAVAAATQGGAVAVGLGAEIGAIAVGRRADLVLLDLTDLAWQPMNSATRQLVYAEGGRAVRSVMVEGRMLLEEGRFTTIDEAAFRAELAEVMGAVRADLAALRVRQAPAIAPLLAANRRLAATDAGMLRQFRP